MVHRPLRPRRRSRFRELRIVETFPVVPEPLLATGIAYPGGREQNPATDNADYDSTTNLSSVRDMTAAVQAAHDALAATGLGGTIMLGPGVWRINGVNITAGGIRVVGTG